MPVKNFTGILDKLILAAILLHNVMWRLPPLYCTPFFFKIFFQLLRAQPVWVNVAGRIYTVLMKVNSPFQSNRVAAYEASGFWVVVSVAIVVQSGFVVKVLSLETERVATIGSLCLTTLLPNGS